MQNHEKHKEIQHEKKKKMERALRLFSRSMTSFTLLR